MKSADLRAHLITIGVNSEGIEYIVDSALTPAQMRLKSGPQQNIVGDISTQLRTYLDDAVEGDVIPRLQIASLSVEHAFFVQLEARPNVLLALNHPLSVPLEITNAIGRRQRINYTCDALVIDDTSALAVELKTDEEANELAERRSRDWHRTNEGFVYLPAKKYFATLGIVHVVVVSSQLPWLRTRNLQMLARLRAWPAGLHEGSARSDVMGYVRANSPCSILRLVAECDLPNATPVLHMIKDGAIHVDLDRVQLSCPDTRSVCATADAAKNVAAALASIQATARINAQVSLIEAGDPKHLDELGFRIAILDGQPAVRAASTRPDKRKRHPSLRTKQRWAKARREGGPQALAPKWANCGNRKRRLKFWHLKLLLKQIKAARRSASAPSRVQAHIDYTNTLDSESRRRKSKQTPVSYGYFCRLWNRRRHNVGDAYERGGRRLANALAPHGDVDKQMPMATGPFQVAHIDHCLAPSHSSSDNQDGGLPWLTLLVDEWEREPLAMVISLNYPSAETDLEVLRNCARRHGRMPHAIISDHGPDFVGTVFIGALAVLHIDGFLRPEANPRVGQSVERTFGTVAAAICRGYEGFALDIPNSRAISSKKHPSMGKKRQLQDFSDHAEHLLFSVIPDLPSAGGGESKLQKRLRFESVYGQQGIETTIDLRFLIATAPPIRDSGCIEPSGAIRWNEKRFYSRVLVGADSGTRKPSLRREPDDRSVIYFAYAGKWHVAKARDALRNYGRSDEVIAEEARERSRDTPKQKSQRRRMLHSKPSHHTATTATESDGSKVKKQTAAAHNAKRVSLASVKMTSMLPLAFEPSLGGDP